MTSKPRHIVFAGGGTGGHLFPGLAVAEELVARWPDVQITFAGTGKSLERYQISSAGYSYIAIPCRPSPRKPWQAVRFLADNLAGFWAARWFLREQEADLVIGLGGYSSAPIARAAIGLDLPTILLEQNAVAGKVTRWLAPSASLVCLSFPQAKRQLKADVPTKYTGNPVRRAFREALLTRRLSAEPSSQKEKKQLLILGGSGGSQSLNESLPRALYKLGPLLDSWQVIHQTGPGSVETTQKLYQKLGLSALVVSFIDNLPDILRETDFVVSRAGGTVIAELALAGLPAALVPFPEAADNHQAENAEVLGRSQAVIRIDSRESGKRLDDQLHEALRQPLQDSAYRQQLGEKLRKFAAPQAASQVVDAVEDILYPQPRASAA